MPKFKRTQMHELRYFAYCIHLGFDDLAEKMSGGNLLRISCKSNNQFMATYFSQEQSKCQTVLSAILHHRFAHS